MTRVEFRLTMPGVGSWDGKWSGAGRNYVVVRHVNADQLAALALPQSFEHAWDDGWRASVRARILGKGERPAKSDGFCGYEWMVDNILKYGRTNSCPPHEWEPDTSWQGFERCPKCRTSRKIAPAERHA